MKNWLLILAAVIPILANADYLNCPCRVVKVTDGDTVHVLDQRKNRHKIRLQGIDAPERSQAFGKKSTQNLAYLAANKFIEVEYSKRDRYRRIVGKLLLKGQDINLQQVRDGFAWHYKQYQKEQSFTDREAYSEAETTAKLERAGLWKDSNPVPPWIYRHRKTK